MSTLWSLGLAWGELQRENSYALDCNIAYKDNYSGFPNAIVFALQGFL